MENYFVKITSGYFTWPFKIFSDISVSDRQGSNFELCV